MPHEEDTWRKIRINGQVFETLKLCTRCQVPTVNQQTGVMDPKHQPLKALKTYRLDDGCGVNFGIHLRYAAEEVAAMEAEDTAGDQLTACLLKIGAGVEVLEIVARETNIPGK